MTTSRSNWNPRWRFPLLSDYLHTIQNRDGETESLYRGQANVLWRVDCSAVRRLAAGSEIDPTLIGHALVAYTDDLLAGASRYVGTCPELSISCSELDILAQLQHQGAATGLMDFTTNPLVALWFACNECFDDDGAVYVLSRSDLQEIKSNEVGMQRVVEYFHGAGLRNKPPVFWRPDGLPGRAKSQDSVFVFGVPILWPTRLERIVIDKKSKSALLDELRVAHNITRDTLFPDLAGYASSNSSSQPFDSRRISQFWERRIEKYAADDASSAQAYVDCGLAYVELQQYAKAKELFTEAITVDTTNIGAYVNRAGAERHLEQKDSIPLVCAMPSTYSPTLCLTVAWLGRP